MRKLARSDLIALWLTSAATVVLVALVFALRTPDYPLRIAYLVGNERGVPNIWTAVQGQPDSAAQITFAPAGIFDFAPSPDGRHIAFSERDVATSRYTLRLADLFTGEISTLTDCASAGVDCTTPAWRPDGAMIAYMRYEDRSPASGGRSRIWMIEGLNGGAAGEYRMFDAQTLASMPVWSGDGRRLAVYDDIGRGVLVFDYAPADPSQQFVFIAADNGITGALSPDGTRLITSTVYTGHEHETAEEHAAHDHAEIAFRPRLVVAELPESDVRPLHEEADVSDGQAAAWHPLGRYAAVLRQHADAGGGSTGMQVYLADMETGAVEPLIVDDAYNHGALAFSPDGGYLLVQRYALAARQPEVWIYEMATGALSKAATGAYLPAWVPGSQ